MKEEWLMPGAVVPVDVETTAALVTEIKRLIGVVDDLKLSRQLWIELTDDEIDRVTDTQWASNNHKPIYAAHRAFARAVEAKLKEKNT